MLRFWFVALLPALVFAQQTPPPLEFRDLMDQPPSRAKDYASELYLLQKADEKEARALFYRVRAPKPSHLSAMAEKSGDRALSALLACRNAGTRELLNASAECLSVALSPARAVHLEPAERRKMADRVESVDPIKAHIFRVMAGPSPLIDSLDEPDAFFAIALQGPLDYLRGHADRALSADQIRRIESDPRMTNLLERSFVHDYPPKLTASLLATDPSRLDHKGALYLGLHALQKGQKALAIAAFGAAESKGWNRYGKDRALFWLYQASGDRAHLEELAGSFDVNFYALIAKERVGQAWPQVQTRVPPTPDAKAVYGEKELFDPFFWARLQGVIARQDSAQMQTELDKLGHNRAEPYRAAIVRRMGSGQNHYFLNPWPDLIADMGISDRAVFLALMRQESHFIPAAISTSYAIGSMQFMPFLIEHMDKERRQRPNAWAHFSPYNQIPYAKVHLKWLQARLAHPLHIAYAYNGGIGFTRRMLEGDIFGSGPYEPFMSLERVPIEEPREYGKIILANYAIYRKLMGDPISMEQLLKTLVPPTDLYPSR